MGVFLSRMDVRWKPMDETLSSLLPVEEIPTSRAPKFAMWFFKTFWESREEQLQDAEWKLLNRFVSTSCWSQSVALPNNVKIRTLKFDLGFPRTVLPVVLVHGFASGLATWAPCLDGLAAKCPVYAIDLPGFGRSSRPSFRGSPGDIELQFVEYLEGWREAVGLEKFLLLGHGFGGYICTLYAMHYPQTVGHLILVEPWGFSELPFNLQSADLLEERTASDIGDSDRTMSSWLSFVNWMLNFPDALSIFRRLPAFCGRWLYGSLFSKRLENNQTMVSADGVMNMTISEKNHFWSCDDSVRYMFLCNSLKPSGEQAFKLLNTLLFWAKNPLIRRINRLDISIPVSFIYGALTVMDHKTGYEVYHLRPESYVEVYLIEKAAHNVFIDNPAHFVVTLGPVLEQGERDRGESVSSQPLAGSAADDLTWDTPWETLNLSVNDLAGGRNSEVGSTKSRRGSSPIEAATSEAGSYLYFENSSN